ncbi:unnamed protein product [Citrullus colocynthis]|uniref:Uncharacterized protein n=1 Tax=Citrullus colocynthis TaxID=252529 RepID=A0ABP0Y8N4_9ROSI
MSRSKWKIPKHVPIPEKVEADKPLNVSLSNWNACMNFGWPFIKDQRLKAKAVRLLEQSYDTAAMVWPVDGWGILQTLLCYISLKGDAIQMIINLRIVEVEDANRVPH